VQKKTKKQLIEGLGLISNSKFKARMSDWKGAMAGLGGGGMAGLPPPPWICHCPLPFPLNKRGCGAVLATTQQPTKRFPGYYRGLCEHWMQYLQFSLSLFDVFVIN